MPAVPEEVVEVVVNIGAVDVGSGCVIDDSVLGAVVAAKMTGLFSVRNGS